ncbi:MAG: molybdopterin molybdotransferase MoeA, partial [Desulfuromonadales bacterium]|nr:molybdopterin molybdotransferase MoeA [Desulfuromonadales bacterium]
MSTTFESARDLILSKVLPLGTERSHLLDVVGRVLAEEVRAPVDMPRWDNSAMDGFAVRSEDCRPGTNLTVTDYIPAGDTANNIRVTPGTAVKIMTGAPVPAGCDAVVPFEETEESGGFVTIKGKVRARDHIRFRGEDVKAGDFVVSAGTVLRPPEISMLASFGRVYVPVFRRPKVAILSTGDELVEPGDAVGSGQIVNSNSFSLAAAVKELGAEPLMLGIARDDRESLLEKFREGLKADVLITSAGVSAGDRDLVREVLEESGVIGLFWKVDVKPGRPTAFGLKDEKPVFSLPGNPVSTMVTFEEFVRPALLKIMGQRNVIKPFTRIALKETTKKKAGRVQFLRVRVTDNGKG